MALSSQAAQEFVQLNCLAWIGGCDGLFEVEGIFQVFEELGDDLIRQLIYELFGAFLESTHDSIISVGAGAGQLPGPSTSPWPSPQAERVGVRFPLRLRRGLG
jgi:hypothetical protein